MNINVNKKTKHIYKLSNDYIAGLVQADGAFSAPLIRGKKNQLYITPQFNISQHIDNKDVILKIKERFNNIGYIRYETNVNQIKYKVTNIKDINNIIIPFFEKYSLRSNKYLTFLKFKYIVDILINKKPLIYSDL